MCTTADEGREVPGLSALVRDADLATLPEAARFHRVTGYVVRQLRRLDGVPVGVVESLTASQRVARAQHLRVRAALEHFCQVMADAPVPWLVVKGPVLAETVYRSADLRFYADLDVIVPAASFSDAVTFLEERGTHVLDRNWTLVRDLRAGELHFKLPMDVELDLHWHLLFRRDQRQVFRIPMHEIFERQRVVQVQGVAVRTTDAVDTLLHLSVHAAVEGGDRLGWLKDIERVIVIEQPDWDDVVNRARRWRVTLPALAMLSRSRTTLGAPVPDEVLGALCAQRSWRAVLATLDRRYPSGATGGQGTPATLVARASRDDLTATWTEIGLGLTRRVGRLMRTGSSQRHVPGLDPRDPGSLNYPTGGAPDRAAFLAAVRDEV
jgi:hypothetical protein